MSTIAESKAEGVCNGLIEAAWLGALILLPLVFNVYSETRYEPDKVVMLRSIAVFGVVAWVIGAVVGARAGWRHGFSSFQKLPFVKAALFVVLASVLGSFVSVAPRLSWLGSYTRRQGTLTLLCYVALFFLVLAYLRRREQWRRMTFAILVTSVPISAHAIAEQLRLDPLGMSELSSRSTGTLGNPIFLAAYLVFAVFVSLERLLSLGSPASWRDRAVDVRGFPYGSVARATVYSTILLLQLGGIVSAKSRGPVAGLLVGLFVFSLIGLIRFKRDGLLTGRLAPQTGSLSSRARRWAWSVPLLVALALFSLLAAAIVPGSPLAPLRQAPYVGRLSGILDLESGTAQVRTLIWRGVADLFADPADRVPPPAADSLLHLRAPFGYGPETLMLVFGRFYPPELGALEGWRSLPDRAHSQTFDALAGAGLVGVVAVLTLFGAIFYRSLVWLLAIRRRRDRRRLVLVLLGGSVAGAILPLVAGGSWRFAAAGVPLGLAVGVIAWAIREGLRERGDSPPAQLPAGLILALFAAMVAHWIELASGIAIVTTSAYLWVLLGVLAVAGSGRLGAGEGVPGRRVPGEGVPSEGVPGEGVPGEGVPGRRVPSEGVPSEGVPGEGVPGGDGRGSGGDFTADGRRAAPAGAVAYGLLCGMATTTLVFGFLPYAPVGDGRLGMLTGSLLGRTEGRPGVLWLLILTWAAGLLLAFFEATEPAGSARHDAPDKLPGVRAIGVFVLASLLPPVVFAWSQAGRLAQAARFGDEGQAARLAEQLATSFSAYHALAFGLMAATGVALALFAGRGEAAERRLPDLGSFVAIFLVLAAVWVGSAPGLRAVRADVLFHHGGAFEVAERFDLAVQLHGLAIQLRPTEDQYSFARGNAYFEWARRTENADDRERFFERALAGVTRAVELNPLDPSHHANAGRVLMSWGATISDPERRRRTWVEADAYFGRALDLHPHSVDFVAERARLRQLLSPSTSREGGQ